jgi:hypothetical protein
MYSKRKIEQVSERKRLGVYATLYYVSIPRVKRHTSDLSNAIRFISVIYIYIYIYINSTYQLY